MFMVCKTQCIALAVTNMISVGDALRWWTLPSPLEGMYIMHKERRAVIPKDFTNKELELPPFVSLLYDLSVRIVRITIANIK